MTIDTLLAELNGDPDHDLVVLLGSLGELREARESLLRTSLSVDTLTTLHSILGRARQISADETANSDHGHHSGVNPSELEELEGLLGFVYLIQVVEASGDAGEPPESIRQECADLLRRDSIANAFRQWYSLPVWVDFSDIRVHRLGTTSLVLRCRGRDTTEVPSGQELALKCLRPRYVREGYERIESETRKYKDEVSGLKHTPRVFASRERFVIMAFVDDRTLDEHIEALRHRAWNQPGTGWRGRTWIHPTADRMPYIHDLEEFEFLRDLAVSLSIILSEYLRTDGRSHSDLSARNIFIAGDPLAGETFESGSIQLIDFGTNFLLLEGVGRGEAAEEAMQYIAPERFDSEDSDPVAGDLYSLGVLLLTTCCRGDVSKETLRDRLHGLWEVAPGWARVIEQLVWPDPGQRSRFFTDGLSRDPYQGIKEVADREHKVVEIFHRAGASRTRLGTGAPPRFRPLRPEWRQVSFQGDIAEAAGRPPAAGVTARLTDPMMYAKVCLTCWIVIFVFGAGLTLADLGVQGTIGSSFGVLHNHLPYQIGTDHLTENLPGRIVGITFGICAVAYFFNIFAWVSAPHARASRSARLAEIFRGSCSFFFVAPIMVTIAVQPRWWPYMSAVGTIAVIGNNFFMWRLVDDAVRREESLIAHQHARRRPYRGSSPGSTRATASISGRVYDFRGEYQEWYLLMASYGVALLAVGILLTSELASDEIVYALIVALGLNLWKMYRLNCVKLAPHVRGNLARSMFLLESLPPDAKT